LDIFKNTAQKLDIQTAVKIGELVSVRCIRIHTDIYLTNNIRDLESKIYVPERNQLIVYFWEDERGCALQPQAAAPLKGSLAAIGIYAVTGVCD